MKTTVNVDETPGKAAAELKPGEIAQYGVISVGDEVMVNLMKSGCGVTYGEAIADAAVEGVDGVRIPEGGVRAAIGVGQDGQPHADGFL